MYHFVTGNNQLLVVEHISEVEKKTNLGENETGSSILKSEIIDFSLSTNLGK